VSDGDDTLGGWPKGEECKHAIAELANAMQTVVGWLPEMDREELRSLAQTLTTMTRIVLEKLGPDLAPSGVWPSATTDAEPLKPPFLRCEYAGGCGELGTRRVSWATVTGATATANVCEEHEKAVVRNLERIGLVRRDEPS
jgi:hypothetical protein